MTELWEDPRDAGSGQRRKLAAAIDALPMKLRAVWLLGAVDRLDYGRIGVLLGLSVAEVERCTARAILQIDRRLSGRRDWLGRWR